MTLWGSAIEYISWHLKNVMVNILSYSELNVVIKRMCGKVGFMHKFKKKIHKMKTFKNNSNFMYFQVKNTYDDQN